jgi:hypothetical protein
MAATGLVKVPSAPVSNWHFKQPYKRSNHTNEQQIFTNRLRRHNDSVGIR